MLTLYDFVEMCISEDFTLEIYDNNSDTVVWRGMAYDRPDEYDEAEVSSFDPPQGNTLTVNVNI